MSYLPFAYSFYAYTAHWWTQTEESLSEAVEEMRPGYADTMQTVIANTPVLIIMLILVIPMALPGMKLAERALHGQIADLAL